jgi:hypothetical protein
MMIFAVPDGHAIASLAVTAASTKMNLDPRHEELRIRLHKGAEPRSST